MWVVFRFMSYWIQALRWKPKAASSFSVIISFGTTKSETLRTLVRLSSRAASTEYHHWCRDTLEDRTLVNSPALFLKVRPVVLTVSPAARLPVNKIQIWSVLVTVRRVATVNYAALAVVVWCPLSVLLLVRICRAINPAIPPVSL